jgi:hypothetical protein
MAVKQAGLCPACACVGVAQTSQLNCEFAGAAIANKVLGRLSTAGENPYK